MKTGMMIIWLMLLVPCCSVAAGSSIQQMFPSDTSYCCPCPSLKLKCTFPEGATTVLWSFPGVASISDDYPDHDINNTLIGIGMSYLAVNSSDYVKEQYVCIAFFPNRPPQENSFISPDIAALILECSHDVTDTSIQINWTNNYPECFNFSVLLDGVTIKNDIANEVSYTINNLRPSTTYNVCVVAHDGHGRTHSEDCDMISTLASAANTADADVDVVVDEEEDDTAAPAAATVNVCSSGIILICTLIQITSLFIVQTF